MLLNTNKTVNRPRVVHLTSVHIPFDTRIFYKELKTLSKAGYDAVLIAKHTRNEVVDGIQVRALTIPQNRFQRIFRTALSAVRIAYQEQGDIYHIHDPELLLWGQFLRLRGKPIIFDIHENIAQDILNKTWIPQGLRRTVSLIYKWLERILTIGMPLIFAEESYSPEYHWVRTPHIIILNMPQTERLLNVQETKYSIPTIGYIGGVNADRGSMITLHALHLLQQAGYCIKWECVGPLSPNHREEMNKFIQLNKISDVHMRGYLLPDEGYGLVARCHIGLAVLTPIPNSVHSYPTKMFEYMALGLPVIASGFPLYRKIIEENRCGLCLGDPTNPSELAEAISWLIDHPQEAAEMGQRGREAVIKQYNWNTEAEKLISFYRQITQDSTIN